MSRHCHRSHDKPKISRREFLSLAGVGTASLFIQSCASREPTVAPVAESSGNISARVAVVKANSYDRDTIASQVQELIEGLGGLGDVVTPGDSVAIKTNLTGGVESGSLPGLEAVDTFVTHPEIARALINEVKAAGASEIFIVEAVHEWASYRQWGYEEIAEDTGAMLIDLNEPKPYNDFRDDAVGAGSFIYESFIFNPIINDIDVFMSISKLKNHYLAGVTHTMKNLYGLVPYRFYRLKEEHQYRSEFHGEGDVTRSRLPRIIVDLNRARPIDFSLVDGVKSTQGGEGPWIDTISAIEPGLLVAGKNSVATDAVATALMGHDPMGEYPNNPYVRCDNHLNIAASSGMGVNNLNEIEVVGESIESAKTNYSPGW